MAAEQTIHLDRYSPDAKALVAGAQRLADERKHAQVEPIHLLARAIERDRGVQEVFGAPGPTPRTFRSKPSRGLRASQRRRPGSPICRARCSRCCARGKGSGDRNRRRRAPSQRAFAGDPRRGGGRAPSVRPRPGLASARTWRRSRASRAKRRVGGRVRAATLASRTISSSALKSGGFDPVIGRDVEVRRLLQILERRQKNHPLLVGEAGRRKDGDRRRARHAHRGGRRSGESREA